MSNPWEIQTIEFDKTNSEGNVDLYGYGALSVLLSKYVLKEKGKGLSSNDFTDTDKLKLDSVETNSQENKVETVTINEGQKIYPDDEKNINISVPTKISQLDNDLGYAKLITTSTQEDYSDSYVGKAKVAFQDETNIAIGKNSNADSGGIALGSDTSTDETYDVNINNQLLHNKETNIWEGVVSYSETSYKNTNGTNLTELDTTINNLEIETQNRINEDEILLEKINGEIQNRSETDSLLFENLNTEIQNRTNQDNLFEINLNAEIQNRTSADSNLSNQISSINNLIPNQASSTNQLADKSFVNSTVQTNTANFRGSWSDWTSVPSDSEDYPQDYAGNTTPTPNDYLVVQDASDYDLETLSGTWRFKYIGDWATDGKNGWIPEYQVNEKPFTSEQLFAINSGITAEKVAEYDEFISGGGEVTGVKGEAETTYRTGDVNITKSDLGLTTDEMGMFWYDSNITSGSYIRPYYANGIWVTGSGNNSSGIKYSTDGKTWYSSNITSGGYYYPYYANGIWVIGCSYNVHGIKYSIDGKTWYDSNITEDYYYHSYYANGIWVIGSSKGIKYSTDGKTWYDSNITSGGGNCPYYANGIWVISGGSSGIKYSIDGKTWYDSNITSGIYNNIYYANGIWVIGSSDNTSNGIKYSIDGKTWYDSNITSGGYYQPYYANGIWVIGFSNGIKYSIDGKTWYDSNITEGHYYYQSYYANGIWVISGGSSGIKYSIDGKTWYDSNITEGNYQVPYCANGIWVISGGSSGIKYSTFNSLNDLGSAFKGITDLSSKMNEEVLSLNSNINSIKSYSDDTFATKSYVDDTFATKTYVDTNFATSSWVSNNFATNSYVNNTFATNSYVNSTFATKSYVNSTFATKSYVVNHKLYL